MTHDLELLIGALRAAGNVLTSADTFACRCGGVIISKVSSLLIEKMTFCWFCSVRRRCPDVIIDTLLLRAICLE